LPPERAVHRLQSRLGEQRGRSLRRAMGEAMYDGLACARFARYSEESRPTWAGK